MNKYKCLVCGWVYDPELGDEEGGVIPGTHFKQIFDNWVCPICKATKNEFEKLD